MMSRLLRASLSLARLVVAVVFVAGCGNPAAGPADAGPGGGPADGGAVDAPVDGGPRVDAGTSVPIDAGTSVPIDAAPPDAPPVTMIRLEVTPATARVPAGLTQAFTATGVFSDSTSQDLTSRVTWSSASTGTATVAPSGVATAIAAGSVEITARMGEVTGTASLTVTTAELVAIEVTPVDPRVPAGRTERFTATGRFSDQTARDLTRDVAWTSSAPAVASISNTGDARGVATGAAVGTTTITAALGATTARTTLTVTAAELVEIGVTPVNPRVPAGRTERFTATGRFSDQSARDLTRDVTWRSSEPTIATISDAGDARGVATGAVPGTVTITAALGDATGSTTLTVTAAELVAIEVTPAAPRVPAGRLQQLTATGRFSDLSARDLTREVTWASSDEAVARVSNAGFLRGEVSALRVGTTRITATLEGAAPAFGGAAGRGAPTVAELAGAVTLTVTAAELVSLSVTPSQATLPLGQVQPFTAIGTFSDLSARDLTQEVAWSSSAPAIATISNADGSRGEARSVAVGSATITAALERVLGSANLTATAAVPTAIVVSPARATLSRGQTQPFTATMTFSDRTERDVTQEVTWSSSPRTVAEISNAAGSRGLATSTGEGTARIRAQLAELSGLAELEVTPPRIVGLRVAPDRGAVAVGLVRRFAAIADLSDGTTAEIALGATWRSSDEAVATVSNEAFAAGEVTGRAVGQATISASFAGFTASATVEVTAPAVQRIEVTPARPVITRRQSQPFTALAVFSDGSSRDVTGEVTWRSSAPDAVTISNEAGSRGVAIPQRTGFATITAALDGVTGSAAGSATIDVLDFDQIIFSKGFCSSQSVSNGLALFGLLDAVERSRFTTARWLNAAGDPVSVDGTVSLSGEIQGLRCVADREIQMEEAMRLVLFGEGRTVTLRFRAIWQPPTSFLSFTALGATIDP